MFYFTRQNIKIMFYFYNKSYNTFFKVEKATNLFIETTASSLYHVLSWKPVKRGNYSRFSESYSRQYTTLHEKQRRTADSNNVY